jgi:hypothetical protein
VTDLCSICQADATGAEGRTLSISGRRLGVSDRSQAIYTALDDERAMACGQTHTLALTERFLERGTFAPADYTHAETFPASVSDAHAELT